MRGVPWDVDQKDLVEEKANMAAGGSRKIKKRYDLVKKGRGKKIIYELEIKLRHSVFYNEQG